MTLLVLKFDKSIFVNNEQKENMPIILVTLLVLKLVKSISIKDEHSLNKNSYFLHYLY